MVYSFSNNDSIHLKIYIVVHIMSIGRQLKYYPDRIRNVGLRLCQKSHTNDASNFASHGCAAENTVSAIKPSICQCDLLNHSMKTLEE